MKLKNPFRRKAKFHMQTDFPVVLAFGIGGKNYFRYEDISNTPGPRMMGILKHYMKLKHGCDENYLLMHANRLKEIISDPKKINIAEISRLNEQLIERLTIGFPAPDDILAYASAIYFDEHESPYRYDDAYNKKKIAFWQQHTDIVDFFLQEPIRSLIPSLQSAESYSRMYSMMNASNLVKLIHLENLLRGSSETQKKTDYYSNLLLQITELKKLSIYEESQLTNISHIFTKN